jgi:hypothetical protein
MRPPPGEKEPEQQFSVDPTPSPSAYEWIICNGFIIISFFFERLFINKYYTNIIIFIFINWKKNLAKGILSWQ